jgi:hypothetical protein
MWGTRFKFPPPLGLTPKCFEQEYDALAWPEEDVQAADVFVDDHCAHLKEEEDLIKRARANLKVRF